MKQATLDAKKQALYQNLDVYNYILNKQMQKRWEIYNFEKEYIEKNSKRNGSKLKNGVLEPLEVGMFKKAPKPKRIIILI